MFPHVAGAHGASPTLQELQMNRSTAIAFAGKNTAFGEYLLPISKGKHHVQRKKEKKGILRSVLSCSSCEFGMSECIKGALY